MPELKKAKEPFRFYTRLHLSELTGLRASTLSQLLGILKEVPGSSIYHHTHRFLQQHQYLSPEPPNDFAYWVSEILGEDELGERLASIDTIQFSNIRSLREKIVETIEDYLRNNPLAKLRFAKEGEEFHFIKSISFILPTDYDDPEGAKVLEEVREKAEQDKDIHILLLPQNDIEVNALQRASTVIIQKSLREGFGLTVAEALWKAKPVVASNVGGIPLQIKHKYSGLLCHSVQGAAFALKQLLNSPDYAKKLGENGREHIRNNFLITRHIREYLLLFLSLYHKEDIVYL